MPKARNCVAKRKDMGKKRLIVIGGPTASGKTEAAIAVARHFGAEIVGADARQVYAELAIGVGRPSTDQLAAVNHHLIGHVSIHRHYSVGHYLQDALPVIDRLFERHDIAILAGGTGLYIQAVLHGIDDMPAVPEALVADWTRIAEAEGLTRLQAETARLDPDYYAIVDRHNPARLVRAITVSLHTGRPYSTFRTGRSATRTFEPILLQADLPRDVLYPRIDRRVNDMLQHGWLDEARALLPYKDLNALRTVGYPELFDHIEGRTSLAEATARICQATRRYAKRQSTWFRHHGEWKSFDPNDTETLIRHVDQRLNT